MTEAAAPPAPSRVRVVRPQFYRSSSTGSLPPDVRDLLIGLTTVTDDEGWLLWSPDELATTIYPYQPSTRRLRDLQRRAERLVSAGLLVIHEECGCAFLPSLKEHHGVKSGRQTSPIWNWHHAHAVGRGMPRNAEERPSSSSSSSSGSGSFEGSASSSSPARDAGSPPRNGAGGEPWCLDCKRPVALHAADCPVRANPALLQVVG